MARRRVHDDWDDEEDFDSSANGADDTIPCPYCNQPVYEGAERCPNCESYLSEEDQPAGQRPWWVLIGILLCALIVVMWIFSV